jgi:hypothetical protein
MVGFPIPFATRVTLPSLAGPPIPLIAVKAAGVDLMSVGFDRELTAGDIDPANWSGRWMGQTITGVLAATNGQFAQFTFVVDGVAAGPDVVNYNPPPFDVTNIIDGSPAAAFSDFPASAAFLSF